jgi:hypothetical protein
MKYFSCTCLKYSVGRGIGRNLQVFTDVMPVLLAVTFYRISSTYAKPRCNYSVLSNFIKQLFRFSLEKYRSFFIFREISGCMRHFWAGFGHYLHLVIH